MGWEATGLARRSDGSFEATFRTPAGAVSVGARTVVIACVCVCVRVCACVRALVLIISQLLYVIAPPARLQAPLAWELGSGVPHVCVLIPLYVCDAPTVCVSSLSVGARIVVCRIYVCRHTTMFVSSHYLLHMYTTLYVCEGPTVCVSSLSVGARIVMCRICMSSYYYMCVLILLYMCAKPLLLYVCPH